MRLPLYFRAFAITVLALLTTLSLAPEREAAAAGVGYVLMNFVDTNDTAPETGGSNFSGFGFDVDLNDNSEVAFSAATGTGTGIFVASGGAVERVVVLSGDPVPGTKADLFGSFLGPQALNASGEVAFLSFGTSSGVFLDGGGAVSKVVLPGDPVPGTPDGTVDGFEGQGVGITASGDVVFLGVDTFCPGLCDQFYGLYRVPTGSMSISVIVQRGNCAPGGGEFFKVNMFPKSVGDDGSVGFWGSVISSVPCSGSGGEGIFIASGGGTSAIVRSGDSAPDTGGGTFSSFFVFNGIGTPPAANNSGKVAFSAQVAGGSVARGLFVGSAAGGISAFALPGQTAPGTGSGTFSAFGLPVLNDNGDAVFRANVIGGNVGQGIFVSSEGSVSAVAVTGDPAPGTGGGTLGAIFTPDMNNAGEVAFKAPVGGGDTTQGIFLALPSKGDSDGDGLTNEYEVAQDCLDPLVDDGAADPDGDGLSNLDEFGLGTDPCEVDTDQDGCSDGEEVAPKSEAAFGGGRNPLYFWDFFDPTRNKAVGFTDFLALVARNHAVGDPTIDPLSDPPPPPAYHTRFDRGGQIPGGNLWEEQPANGSIGFSDFLSLVRQQRATCLLPP